MQKSATGGATPTPGLHTGTKPGAVLAEHRTGCNSLQNPLAEKPEKYSLQEKCTIVDSGRCYESMQDST